MEQGQFVEHVGEPLRLLFPVHAQSPQGVRQRFLAHVHLRRAGLLVQVHDGTADGEVLVEVVVPVDAEHGLALHGEVGVRLERHVDVGAGVDDALVEDGHLARRIVDAVVRALLQGDAACGDHHRALRHVHRAERDDVGRRTLELSGQDKLVLLGVLLGDSLGRVVELVEAVLVGQLAHALLVEPRAQIVAEGLGRRQEDAAVVNGIALHVVELSVGVGLHVVVHAVQSHDTQQNLALQLLLGQIGEIGAGGVALVLDVQTELLLLDLSGQIVDVLHHQVPVALQGGVAGVLQGFHEEALVGLRQVGGELAHLEGLTAVGVLEGNGEHLVGLQCLLQRDITQGAVQRVLR